MPKTRPCARKNHVRQGRDHVRQGRDHERHERNHERQGRAHERQGRDHERQARDHERVGRDHERQGRDHVHQGRAHERQGREQGRGQCVRAATMCGMAAPKPRPGGKIGGLGEMYGVCTVTRQNVRGLYGYPAKCTGLVRDPRSLHFR